VTSVKKRLLAPGSLTSVHTRSTGRNPTVGWRMRRRADAVDVADRLPKSGHAPMIDKV